MSIEIMATTQEVAQAKAKFAQCNLGDYYELVKGIGVDMNEAIKWYKLSAEAGVPTAQCNLGDCYELGKGIGVDMNEAIKWYTLAAKGGNDKAIKKIALLTRLEEST